MFSFLFSLLFSPAFASELIVWNVGQGQWVTEVHSDFCEHYDLGGERNPLPKVLQACRSKKNYLHLSHWDWDHISFVESFASKVRDVCLTRRPHGEASAFKIRKISSVPLCSEKELKVESKASRSLFQALKAKNANENSEVIWSRDFQTLIPGDSPKVDEKIWAEDVPARTVGLILGHHGSRTSSSQNLLNHLSHLKFAVASARKSRYGHPHRQVVELLKKEKVPLLKTEDWGHLHFMKESD